MANSHPNTALAFQPIHKATPNTTSRTQIAIAIPVASGAMNSVPKTTKYSSNLYPKPRGSLALMRPEKINKAPVKNLMSWIIIFIV